jgi:hypothetical protein
MRQGPTLGASETNNPNNLAFGRPPVCILRIGDFYHTKIIIENLNFSFEPLVWDLNPEGVGVQPMIANVTMSFKFIGASTLMGPLNKLQNALSFNYFANAQVYDPRADYFAEDSDGKNANANEIPKYILKNGISGTASPDITITPEIIKDNTPEIDQVKANEQAAVAQSVENIDPDSPKLTSIDFILVENANSTGVGPSLPTNKNSILLKMNSKNIVTGGFIVENDVRPYVEKGIKITIKGVDVPDIINNKIIKNDFYYEEIVKFDNDGNTFKGISALVSNGYKIGDGDSNGVLLDIPNGFYTLSILEQSNTVSKAMITVGKDGGFTYFNTFPNAT